MNGSDMRKLQTSSTPPLPKISAMFYDPIRLISPFILQLRNFFYKIYIEKYYKDIELRSKYILSWNKLIKEFCDSSGKTYVMRCAIWYQSLFGVCMIVRTHANGILTLFSTFMSFLSVCMSYHGVLTGLSNFKH